MNSRTKKTLDYLQIGLVLLFALYSIFVLSGFQMVLFFYAASPLVSDWETLFLNYLVWVIFGLALLAPAVLKLRQEQIVTVQRLKSLSTFLFNYNVIGALACLVLFFFVHSLWLTQLCFLGLIATQVWYTRKIFSSLK